MKRFAALSAAFITLAGCTTTSGLPGVSLSATAAAAPTGADRNAIMAAMAGGLIGGPVGENLSRTEKSHALEAEYRALETTPSGQKVVWRGSDPQRFGEVAAAQPYRVGSQDCRQYSQTVFTEAGSQTARGTACRNADGSWTPLT
jgi:surface antigen